MTKATRKINFGEDPQVKELKTRIGELQQQLWSKASEHNKMIDNVLETLKNKESQIKYLTDKLNDVYTVRNNYMDQVDKAAGMLYREGYEAMARHRTTNEILSILGKPLVAPME